jgi:hypothetical protein
VRSLRNHCPPTLQGAIFLVMIAIPLVMIAVLFVVLTMITTGAANMGLMVAIGTPRVVPGLVRLQPIGL